MVGADSLLRAQNPSLMVIRKARVVWSRAGRERVGVAWASRGGSGPSHAPAQGSVWKRAKMQAGS